MSAGATPGPTRRGVLLGVAGLVCASGCGSGGSGKAPASSATQTPASGAAPSATSAAPTAAKLPATTPWVPGPGEVSPQVKARAVAVVEALGAWPPGGGGQAAAQARAAALGVSAAVADEAGPLVPDADAAALQVIYAQYGGILDTSASVLIPCRQWTQDAQGTVSEGGTTVDVRLAAGADPSAPWAVTELRPADPGPPAASLSAVVSRVLAEPRIDLPPAAAADFRSGQVHDSVAEALLALAGTYEIRVSVVRSGHPIDVFGTTRPSDHPLGRAVDVWSIDGHAVVDPATPRALVEGFMRAAAAAGSYNVGGPYRLSGGGTSNQFFTDQTHHDHVHMGFRT